MRCVIISIVLSLLLSSPGLCQINQGNSLTWNKQDQIDTADQLIILGKAPVLQDKHFVLGADVDLDPGLQDRRVYVQAPIQVFTGVFDGNGHVISNMTITGTNYLGLFGRLESEAEIKDLGIVDVQDLIVLADHLFEEVPPIEQIVN